LAGGDRRGGVDVSMTSTCGGAVERRTKKVACAVEVHDGVGASDVERKSVVEYDTFMDFVCGGACVRDEWCWLYYKALSLRVYGLDWVGVVDCVEN